MLKSLIFFLVLIAGVVLGPMIAGHQGYVLIQTADWNIETSVTALVIMLLLSLLVILMLEWILRNVLQTGHRTRRWFSGRRHHRAQRYTQSALMKLAEGDYLQVEKLFSRSANLAEKPLANYLLAAEAAQQRGDTARANQHVARAAELAEDDQFPVEITRARLMLERNENHAARRSIDSLLRIAPHHPQLLRMAEQVYCRTGAWRALLDILPRRMKTDPGATSALEKLQQQAWLGLMQQIIDDEGSEELIRWWYSLERKYRRDVTLQVAIVEHLIACNDHDAAQKILLEALKKHNDTRLIILIPRVLTAGSEKLEKALQHQIKQWGSTPLLDSTLGQLLMRRGEWQGAATAFRAALAKRPDAYDFAWLADVCDHLHLPEEAASLRREGLLLTLKNSPPPLEESASEQIVHQVD